MNWIWHLADWLGRGLSGFKWHSSSGPPSLKIRAWIFIQFGNQTLQCICTVCIVAPVVLESTSSFRLFEQQSLDFRLQHLYIWNHEAIRHERRSGHEENDVLIVQLNTVQFIESDIMPFMGRSEWVANPTSSDSHRSDHRRSWSVSYRVLWF